MIIDDNELTEEARQQLVELANAMSYEEDDDYGSVISYESDEYGDEYEGFDYDIGSPYGGFVRAPIGRTFAIKLFNSNSGDPATISLFDGTPLPSGIVESPAGRNDKIVTWARGGHQIGIRAFKVSATSQAKRDGFLFSLGEETPFGGRISNEVSPLDFASEKDYQSAMQTMPVQFIIDGFRYFRFNLDAQDTISLVFYVGAVVNPISRLRGIQPAFPTPTGLVPVRPARPRPRPSIGGRRGRPGWGGRPTGRK